MNCLDYSEAPRLRSAPVGGWTDSVPRHWEISDADRIDFSGLAKGIEKCLQDLYFQLRGTEGQDDLRSLAN
jgi:hypothetical protein